MKRFIVLLLALVMIFALVACGGKTAVCEICGETKQCKEIEVFGEKGMICSDCEKKLNDLLSSLGDLDLG